MFIYICVVSMYYCFKYACYLCMFIGYFLYFYIFRFFIKKNFSI